MEDVLWNDFVGFWLAGLFNNSSYVIMLAGAKHISPDMVGLVGRRPTLHTVPQPHQYPPTYTNTNPNPNTNINPNPNTNTLPSHLPPPTSHLPPPTSHLPHLQVYVANEVPSLLVKLTGPYWFHLIPYPTRMALASLLMALSFVAVAGGGQMHWQWAQLLGVALGSVQSGFGEASFLALTAFYDSRSTLTAWSSGTGFAGIFGYAW
eukprot:CAMPEP_0173224564 /NCGR_PEP_ID=MMETSP1142-20121109/4417_1 /TAXON_ID=483371 /ORGANISM="non described non described, Strain CCMP2298" /LENGTH=205 /DNA_ID=CAMNT_0014152861 /DNA_START=139 /DNA_END=754 /DNA_ORIENTATION=-